jgi:hypothetical protein
MKPGSNIDNLQPGQTGRSSSWDRSGGNKDFITIAPGETLVAAEIEGPGRITHLWFTGWQHYRDLLIKITWDDAEEPSVLCPYGDFFGQGNCFVNSYESLWFTSSTDNNNKQHKLTALNCYLPMPFRKRARIEFVNEGDKECRQYFYIDYETYADERALGPDPAYLHAEFRMERPFGGWGPELWPNSAEVDGILLTGRDAWDQNYVLADVKGRGHYIGCFFNVVNLQAKRFRGMNDPSYAWWGEGDEMIWVDGYSWPPDIHGTGSEDYFNQAMGMQRNAYLRNGTAVHEFDTGGFSTSYVFHVENPVRFRKELRATIEIGHANHLGNDISSVAFFYLDRPAGVTPPPPAEIRRPIERIKGIWRITDKNRYTSKQIPVDADRQLEIDQGRRQNASDFWVTELGKLVETRPNFFALLHRREQDPASGRPLRDLLRSMAETAANTKAPKVLLDILGAEGTLDFSGPDELPENALAALTQHRDQIIKITAGVLLEEERSRCPEALCKITIHTRITFRDHPAFF